jgi:hypothetical protein
MSLNMSGHAHVGLQRLYDYKYNSHSYIESLILNDTEKDLTFPLCLPIINNLQLHFSYLLTFGTFSEEQDPIRNISLLIFHIFFLSSGID